MKIEFWEQRWDEDQIGFHLSDVNPYLTQYWPELNLPDSSVVLVPMCGKSLDMVWLASKGFSVLGVECSKKAIQGFVAEQKLDVTTESYKDYTVHNSLNVSIMQGDFFKLDTKSLSKVTAVYDRASLVALPAEMRKNYVDLLDSKLPDKVQILLVTIEYNQKMMSGPPFSVSSDEVQQLYNPSFNVELLQESDVLNESPRFKQKGLNVMIERVYKISR